MTSVSPNSHLYVLTKTSVSSEQINVMLAVLKGVAGFIKAEPPSPVPETPAHQQGLANIRHCHSEPGPVYKVSSLATG